MATLPAGATNVCTPNGSVLLRISNIGDFNSPTYQWLENDVEIPGATSSTLEVKKAGSYKIKVYADDCSNTSAAVTLGETENTSLAKPLVTKIPTTGQICGVNGRVILRFGNVAEFTGSSYQWYKNNEAISGTNNQPIYEVSTSGDYRVVVTSGTCLAMSENENIVASPTGSITKPVLDKVPNSTQICENGSVRLFVQNSADYPNATYIWYKGTDEVQNGSASSYPATTAGTYFVQVVSGTDASCSSTSDKITLTISTGSTITEPKIRILPNNETPAVCGNNGVVVLTLTNAVQYASEITYQWYKDGNAISGANKITYSATSAGVYYLEVNSPNCSAISKSVTVKNDAGCNIAVPELIVSPEDGKIRNEEPVNIAIKNESVYTEPEYYWFKDGELVEEGPSSIDAAEEGSYQLLVVDGDKAAWSKEVGVAVYSCDLPRNPLMSVLPEATAGTHIICGENGSIFMALQNVEDYVSSTYQWYRNGNLISGATSSYYNAKQAGAYKLRIIEGTPDACSGYSAEFVVDVNNSSVIKPAITRMSPSFGIICGDADKGGSVMLILENRGDYSTNNTSFKWYKNGVLISGAAKYTYEAKEAGLYQLQVIDGTCGTTAAEFDVKWQAGNVTRPTVEKSGVNVCGEHGSALLWVTNTEIYTDPKYQWFLDDLLLAGETNPTLEAKVGGEYRVQVVEGTCGAFSVIEELQGQSIEITKPLLQSLPANNMICGDNGSVLLRVSNASEFSNPTYQWYKGGYPIAGATASGYEVSAAGAGAYYRVQVTEGECSAFTASTYIRVNASGSIAKPELLLLPNSKVISGDKGVVVLYLNNRDQYTPSTDYTYQWFKDNNPITGETTRKYNAKEAGTYQLYVANGDCGAFTVPVVITKNASGDISKPEIITDPSDGNIVGEKPVEVELGNPDHYDNEEHYWFEDDELVSSDPTFVVDEEGEYELVIVDGNEAAGSDPIVIGTRECDFVTPELSVLPESQVVCGSNGAVFMTVLNVEDYASPVEYLWYRDDVALNNARTSAYKATVAGVYKLQIKDALCEGFSEEITVERRNDASIPAPVMRMSPSNGNICGENGSVMLILTNAGDFNPDRPEEVKYQWYKDGQLIEGANKYTYEALEPGLYRLQVLDGQCSAVSDELEVKDKPDDFIYKPTIAKSGTKVCGEKGSVLMWITNADQYSSSLRYQWFLDDLLLDGATLAAYEAKVEGNYKLQVTDGECGAFNEIAEYIGGSAENITEPEVVSFPEDAVVCGTNGSVMLQFTNAASYSANATYQWYKNNLPITGATLATYETTEAGNYR
ncbi:hypothetical protein LJC11_05180, partial [Bacteroidales bacterium OttesenSCG-928-I21]|nr:hypothetical protein [Bacteroidales bacterium OttesenSCG-928-I21]